MKKTLLSLALISITYCANAQVGVGTNTPQSTLDIKEKRTGTTNDVSAHDGLLIPKLTKVELAAKDASAYTVNQNGAIIYISNISGTPTGTSLIQVANIDAIGFYYFDGDSLVWKKLDTNTNLYSVDGVLSNNRIVTMDTKTLKFRDNFDRATDDPNVQEAFVFGEWSRIGNDINPLMVINSNRRIGLNRKAPKVTLEIESAFASSKEPSGLIIPRLTSAELSTKDLATYKRRDLTLAVPFGHDSHEGTLVYVIGDTNTGLVSPSSSSSVSYSRMQEVTKEGLYYFGFDEKWHPVGGNSVSTNIYTADGTLAGNRVVTQGTNTLSFINNSSTPSGNKVGIGTSTPAEALDVVGNVKVSSLANATNKIVYADAGGVLKLVSPEELNPPKAILNTSQSSVEQRSTIYDGPCYKTSDNTSSCTITINHYTSCAGFQTPVSTQIVVMNGINTSGTFLGTWSANFIDNKGYTNTTAIANQVAPDYPRITYSSNKANYLGSGTFNGQCNVDLVATVSTSGTVGNVKIESVKRSMYAHLVYLVGVSRTAQ